MREVSCHTGASHLQRNSICELPRFVVLLFSCYCASQCNCQTHCTYLNLIVIIKTYFVNMPWLSRKKSAEADFCAQKTKRRVLLASLLKKIPSVKPVYLPCVRKRKKEKYKDIDDMTINKKTVRIRIRRIQYRQIIKRHKKGTGE